jgi:hypothetical protein
MAKTVYYSPFGGEVYAVLAGSSGDPDYEESLRANHVPFRKFSTRDDEVPSTTALATLRVREGRVVTV